MHDRILQRWAGDAVKILDFPYRAMLRRQAGESSIQGWPGSLYILNAIG